MLFYCLSSEREEPSLIPQGTMFAMAFRMFAHHRMRSIAHKPMPAGYMERWGMATSRGCTWFCLGPQV